jgi:hypothetical protein
MTTTEIAQSGGEEWVLPTVPGRGDHIVLFGCFARMMLHTKRLGLVFSPSSLCDDAVSIRGQTQGHRGNGTHRQSNQWNQCD